MHFDSLGVLGVKHPQQELCGIRRQTHSSYMTGIGRFVTFSLSNSTPQSCRLERDEKSVVRGKARESAAARGRISPVGALQLFGVAVRASANRTRSSTPPTNPPSIAQQWT
jgi:hypothetical protein